MIEITLTEVALFAWAVLATAAAFKYKDEARMGKHMLRVFVENKEARDQLIAAHAKFMEERS